MVLKIYFDFLSQPSRAVLLLARANSIPCKEIPVALRKGEHKTDEFEKINRFQKVPAIDHDGFLLAESVAILRYMCRTFPVKDHWYPKDSQAMAKVDEYMSWQHLNVRSYGSLYFMTQFIPMMMGGDLPSSSKISKLADGLGKAVDDMENIWLKNTPYVAGNNITIADLLASTELEMPGIVGYNMREGRPNVSKYLDLVKSTLSPHYEDVHAMLYKATEKYKETAEKRSRASA